MKSLEIGIDDISPFLYLINLYPCPPGFDTQARVTPMNYLLYVHRGQGRFIIAGAEYTAQEGDVFFCAAGVPNRIVAAHEDPFLLSGMDFTFTQAGSQWHNGILQHQPEEFGAEMLLESVKFFDFDGFLPQLNVRGDSSLHQRVLEMADIYTRQHKHFRPQLNGLFLAFLIRLVQLTNLRFFGKRESVASDEILHFIHEHFREPLPNDRMGDHFHYHPDYISRIVYAYTGLTLRQYIIDLRVREAITLLITTRLPIEEVALRVGYDNPQYFSRIFKQKTGHSPSDFRSFIH